MTPPVQQIGHGLRSLGRRWAPVSALDVVIRLVRGAVITGRITAGRLKVGDHLVFSPSNKRATIKSVEAFNILVQRYSERLTHYLFGFLGDMRRCEDLLKPAS